MHKSIYRFMILLLLAISCSWHVLTADQYLKLYLTGEGTPNSQVITDSSSNNYQITPFGNVKSSNSQSKFGESAIFVCGGYLSVPQTTDWDFGTGDFTVDFWYQFAADSCGGFQLSSQSFINNGSTFSLSWSVANIFQNASFNLRACNCDGGQIKCNSGFGDVPPPYGSGEFPYDFQPHTWHHVAVVGKGGNQVKIFVNGNQIGLTKNFAYNLSCNKNLKIGGPIYGYLDEFRVSKGIARWWNNFTPLGPHASVNNFAASPNIIQSGQSTNLIWAVKDAETCTITPGIGNVSSSGSRTISPSATTNYVLTATGYDGKSVSANLTIDVLSSNKPGTYYEYDSMGRIKKVIKIIPQ
ncbi:MAG: hypothetical protein EHM45_02905 [Desulfobacteraceae bacterium]|nr:MAG: hypothetical protein EHM45_02905 [Desulfobacteraceae bacterium]